VNGTYDAPQVVDSTFGVASDLALFRIEIPFFSNLLEFEWDPQKAAANLAKHKVSFEEPATVSAIRLVASSYLIRAIRLGKSGLRS
jgi:hypothetical protein